MILYKCSGCGTVALLNNEDRAVTKCTKCGISMIFSNEESRSPSRLPLHHDKPAPECKSVDFDISFYKRAVFHLERSVHSLQAIVGILVIIVVLFAAKSFDGVDLYVLPQGDDDGMVHARLYRWWGLTKQYYDIKRISDDHGGMMWGVKKKEQANDSWRSLTSGGEIWFWY